MKCQFTRRLVAIYLCGTIFVVSSYNDFKKKLKSSSNETNSGSEKIVLGIPGTFYFLRDSESSKADLLSSNSELSSRPSLWESNQYPQNNIANTYGSINSSEISGSASASASHSSFYYINHGTGGRGNDFESSRGTASFMVSDPNEGWTFKGGEKIPQSISYGYHTGDKDVDIFPLYEPPKSHQSVTFYRTPESEYETITKTYWPPVLPPTPSYTVPIFQLSTTPYFPYRPPTIPYTMSPYMKYGSSTTTVEFPTTTPVPMTTFRTTTTRHTEPTTTLRTTTPTTTHRPTPTPSTFRTTTILYTHRTTTRKPTVMPTRRILTTRRTTRPPLRPSTLKPIATTTMRATTRRTTTTPITTIPAPTIMTTPIPVTQPPKLLPVRTTEAPPIYETEVPLNFGPGGITPPTLQSAVTTPQVNLPLVNTPARTYGVPRELHPTSTAQPSPQSGYMSSNGAGEYGVPGHEPGIPLTETPPHESFSFSSEATPKVESVTAHNHGTVPPNSNIYLYQPPETTATVIRTPPSTYGAPGYPQTVTQATTTATPTLATGYNLNNAGAYGVPGHVPGAPLSEYVPATMASSPGITTGSGSYGVPGHVPGEPLGEEDHTIQRRVQTNNGQDQKRKNPSNQSRRQQLHQTPALYFLPPPLPAMQPLSRPLQQPNVLRQRPRQHIPFTTTTEEPSLWSLLGLDL